jgi:Xaa-Pro aminopeptidase
MAGESSPVASLARFAHHRTMDTGITASEELERHQRLIAAEASALALLDAIEEAGLIAPGRTEREVERDILRLAADRFGVEKHWHKRIVRAGPNTLATAGDHPPRRTIGDDDMVFLDLGPVFAEWEADVGRSYAVGPDPLKHRLAHDLPIQFEMVKRHALAHPEISGADLYAFAVRSAEQAGWRFGGEIAGHVVGEFPHAHWAGVKHHRDIRPENGTRLCDPDSLGRRRHWILEIHLTAPDGSFGGFYERLLDGA